MGRSKKSSKAVKEKTTAPEAPKTYQELQEEWSRKFKETVNLNEATNKIWKKLLKAEVQIQELESDFQAADEDPDYKNKLKLLEDKSLKFWGELKEVVPNQLVGHLTGYRDRPTRLWMRED